MLEEKIQKDLAAAMKARDEVRMAALRSVKTARQNEKTNGKFHELTEADVVKIVQKQIKQRRESEAEYLEGGRLDLASKEKEERLVMEEYVPKQLTEAEVEEKVREIIAETGASSMKDMGKVMGVATKRFAGRADGKVVSALVRQLLAE